MSDPAYKRVRPEAHEPSPFAFKWMATLPASVRPIKLARRYPRIVNDLALMWHEPTSCRPYLAKLLFDPSRPHRAGFSIEIVDEILLLHEYFDRQFGDSAFTSEDNYSFFSK